MSKKFTVRLDEPFQNGSLNDSFFVDLPNMNDIQVATLSDFISKTTSGLPLPGKNKPSHLDDSLNKIPGTDSYESGNYWHYHCGPSYSPSTKFALTYNLQMNLNGSPSAEVIHYIKEDDDINIVGYSPRHIPFPLSDSIDNPLFSDEDN